MAFEFFQQLVICMQLMADITKTVTHVSSPIILHCQVHQLQHRTLALTCWSKRCCQTKYAHGTALKSMSATLSLVEKIFHGVHLLKRLHSDLLILSSPGVAFILVFESTASDQLRIVDDEEDCNGVAILCLESIIRTECPCQTI